MKAAGAKFERRRWAVALCLCALCFSMCLGMPVRPTLADEPGYLEKDVMRIDASRWGDGVYGDNEDSFGELRRETLLVGGAFDEPGVIGWARYRLESGKFERFYCNVFCGEASTAQAAMRLRIYADDAQEPIYVSGPITRATRAFDLQVDVRGVSVLELELVQADSFTPPAQGEPAGYILLAWANFKRAVAETTAAAAETGTTTTGSWPQAITYVPVTGWYNLYQQSAAADTGGGAFSYVYSLSGNPQEDRTPVYVKGDAYYFEALINDVYLALRQNGTFDVDDAVWAGPDGLFGTADDRTAVLRTGSFFYEEKPGEWKLLASRYDYADLRWSLFVYPTTAATTTTAAGTIETTANEFLSAGELAPPKTGAPFNTGLLVSLAVLLMGCFYCGCRVLRKERA